MVRPCSCSANDRNWQRASKTRSTPCPRHSTPKSPRLVSITAMQRLLRTTVLAGSHTRSTLEARGKVRGATVAAGDRNIAERQMWIRKQCLGTFSSPMHLPAERRKACAPAERGTKMRRADVNHGREFLERECCLGGLHRFLDSAELPTGEPTTLRVGFGKRLLCIVSQQVSAEKPSGTFSNELPYAVWRRAHFVNQSESDLQHKRVVTASDRFELDPSCCSRFPRHLSYDPILANPNVHAFLINARPPPAPLAGRRDKNNIARSHFPGALVCPAMKFVSKGRVE